jgi:hypothetical protein
VAPSFIATREKKKINVFATVIAWQQLPASFHLKEWQPHMATV